jgi:RNA-binding protein
MGEITSADRKFLRQLAHPLKPVVQVGAAGASDGLIAAVEEALQDHELIKVRFVEHKGARKELTREIAERSGSAIAGIIGHVAILYREAREEENRDIVLPSARRDAG